VFRSLLIANRGEIALRVARTAKRLGLRTIAVFTEPDRHAPHVRGCDEACGVSSYLDIASILCAPGEAVHPR
jgi:acetyl/propionyl-CoA carboxylase alpha subunit